MAATFNPALTTPKDKVRFRIGDTDVANPDIQDETIAALLAETGASVLSVSLRLVQGLVATYARKVTYDVDGQGERWSDAAKQFRGMALDIADELAAEKAQEATEENVAASVAIGGGIMVGGTSVRKNIAKSEDTDRAANYGARYET